jgi:hypothetical protein
MKMKLGRSPISGKYYFLPTGNVPQVLKNKYWKEPYQAIDMAKKLGIPEDDIAIVEGETKMDLTDKIDQYIYSDINEGSKEDAMGALKALISFMEKNKQGQDKDSKEIMKMAKGIKSYADKNDGSMTPEQAKWVADTWKSMNR